MAFNNIEYLGGLGQNIRSRTVILYCSFLGQPQSVLGLENHEEWEMPVWEGREESAEFRGILLPSREIFSL